MKILLFISLFFVIFNFIAILVIFTQGNTIKNIKKKLELTNIENERIRKAIDTYNRGKKENEKLLIEIYSNNNIDSFNACNELLSKL